MAHPADEMVQSAYAPPVRVDEYVLPAAAPAGALVKADNVKLVVDAQRDGKLRLQCGSWEDARVLQVGQMLAIRRESTFWVISRIDVATLQPVQGATMVDLGENPTPAAASHAIGQLAHGLKQRFENAGVLIATEVENFVEELRQCYLHLEGAKDVPAAPPRTPEPVPGVDTPSVDLLLQEVAGLRSGEATANARIAAQDATIADLTAKLAAANTPAPPPTLTGEQEPIDPTTRPRLPADTVVAQPPTTPYPEGGRDPATNPAPTAAELHAADPATQAPA